MKIKTVYHNMLYTKKFIIEMCSFTVSDFVDKTHNVHLTCRTQPYTERILRDHPYVTSSYKILRKPSVNTFSSFLSHQFLNLKKIGCLKCFKNSLCRATDIQTISYAAIQTNYIVFENP